MSKRKWNRFVSLLMAAVMVVTLFVSTGITATAEGTPVQNVDVTIAPKLLLARNSYDEAYYKSNVTVVAGECTVESIEFYDGSGNPLMSGQVLYADASYYVEITLKTNEGVSFDPNATVTINGESLSDDQYLHRHDPEYNMLEIEWLFQTKVIEYIEDVNLTGVPAATPGNTADQYTYTCQEGDEVKYTVTGTWHEYDSSAKNYIPMATTATFREDGAYSLLLGMVACPGYAFYEPNVTVNDEWVDLDSMDKFECTVELNYSFGTEITEVDFTVPEPVVGQDFSAAAPITATVPSGSNYTVEGIWSDEDGNEAGTFTKGEGYYFHSTIFAADGYYLSEDVAVSVNGTILGYFPGGKKILSVVYNRSLKTPINEAVLTNVPKAEPGKALQAGDIPIEVPADAKYQATAIWFDEDGNPTDGENAEAGKKYFLEISLEAAPGYEFAENYLLKINGVAHKAPGGYVSVMYTIEYSFLEKIRKAEVTGAVDPVVGQTPSTDTLKSADPAKYDIKSVEWVDWINGLPATKFEKGHAYTLTVVLEAKPGYEFAPYASWKLGREESFVSASDASSDLLIYISYSLETIIPEIRINNIPSMKVGETARTDISVPVGANYSAQAFWSVWDEEKGSFIQFSGIFEQGKTYKLMISAQGNEGYRFEEGVTVCYVDGVLNEDVAIYKYGASYETVFTKQDDEVIHKVEINVQKPQIGGHSSIDPVFTIPENANYRLVQSDIYHQWRIGKVQDSCDYIGYFEEGHNYGVSIILVANEGYVFAEDLVLVVNGVIPPTEAYGTRNSKENILTYFFDMTCQHIYDDANGKCIACGAADPDFIPEAAPPQTGDNSNIWLWFALLFVSSAGIFGITLYDRKRKQR